MVVLITILLFISGTAADNIASSSTDVIISSSSNNTTGNSTSSSTGESQSSTATSYSSFSSSSSSSNPISPSTYNYTDIPIEVNWGFFLSMVADSANNIYILGLFDINNNNDAYLITKLDGKGNFLTTIYPDTSLLNATDSWTGSIYVDSNFYIYAVFGVYPTYLNYLCQFDQSGNLLQYLSIPGDSMNTQNSNLPNSFNKRTANRMMDNTRENLGLATSMYISGITHYSSLDNTIENTIVVSTTDGLVMYTTNFTLLDTINLSPHSTTAPFQISSGGWIYSLVGGGIGQYVAMIYAPNGTAVANQTIQTSSPFVIGARNDTDGFIFDGFACYKLDINGEFILLTRFTGIASPLSLAQVPSSADRYYVLDQAYHQVSVFDTVRLSTVYTIQPTDRIMALTSITADDSYIYLGLNSPFSFTSILKLNTTTGQQVMIKQLNSSSSILYGLKRHPIDGDLYIINLVASSSGSSSSSASSSPEDLTWHLVRLDSNLNVKNESDLGCLRNVTTLSASFAFDRYGRIYQLVTSDNSIYVIDSQTGQLQYKIPLNNIYSGGMATQNSLWVDSEYSVYIANPGWNVVYHIVFDPNANYNASIVATYNVDNPTSVAVNSYGYVFIISDLWKLQVYDSTDSTRVQTSRILNATSSSGGYVTVTAVDLWIDTNDDVYIGRQNAATILMKSNIVPVVPPSWSSSSSTGMGPVDSSSSTGSSDEPHEKTNVGAMVGIGVGALVIGVLIGVLIGMKFCKKSNSSTKDENSSLLFDTI
jgi:hypothetical protein